MARPIMLFTAQNSAGLWFRIIFVFVFGYVVPGFNPCKMGNLARLGFAPFAPLACGKGRQGGKSLRLLNFIYASQERTHCRFKFAFWNVPMN
jgi:hypothetical protein